MDTSGLDTDTMLVMLSSLLHPQEFEQDVLLDALVKSQGDVDAAAKSLQIRSPKKRRRISKKVTIDAWLKGDEPSSSSVVNRSDYLKELASTVDSDPRSISPPRSGRDSPRLRDRAAPPVKGTAATLEPDLQSVSPKKPVSKVKKITSSELMAILRPPDSSDDLDSKVKVPRLPPLTLTTPEMVAENTPCTLHHSVLPPELACRRATDHTGLNSTDDMKEEAQYWYNGRLTDAPPTFPSPMEEACQIIEEIVNAEMRKRRRFPLEWGGYPASEGEEPLIWRANVAASNCYAGGKQCIGYHTDQLTYLGPYPTIASLSLGEDGQAGDKARCRPGKTDIIQLIIMHASTQEVFKHAVPPQSSIDMFHPSFPPPSELTDDKDVLARLQEASNTRINITFRFFRPDFHSSKTPRCKCGIPCILRPDMKNRYDELQASAPQGIATPSCASNGKDVSRSSTSGMAGIKTMVAKYWWTCYAGAQNDGKGCGYWKVMDLKAEGRGPFVGDVRAVTV
ncbi:hypothetical protein BN946_scf185002.g53 [Trametes cinnabarina]|uniref:Fe2OG dioxygenase domain-containing protein n=1 Tax=Pycnoporus cinnabarinus TaxID=5643 RepID=A0A060SKD1_PYCCI|nr:hypothetical protein BN946_scf185002.g53 [Trametes cinnabarina]